MQSSEDLDFQKQKISLLEKEIVKLQDELSLVVASVREVQKYLIRLAQNQALVSEQVASWPYIVIPPKENIKKTTQKKDDRGSEK